jgi:hypothetical protein
MKSETGTEIDVIAMNGRLFLLASVAHLQLA